MLNGQKNINTATLTQVVKCFFFFFEAKNGDENHFKVIIKNTKIFCTSAKRKTFLILSNKNKPYFTYSIEEFHSQEKFK